MSIITFMHHVRRGKIVFLAVLAVCVLPTALADDHYAAKNGQMPAGDYTTWTSAASNIQDAVNAATTNDTVWVGAGRYTVPPNATNFIGTNVVYIDRPLTLRSSNGVPATTIIDGQGANRGVTWYYAANSTSRFALDGLTISNCYATNTGGGILFYPGGVWTGQVLNCVIISNTVAWGTNAGHFYASGNNASRGGGIGEWHNSLTWGLTVTNTVIKDNQALYYKDATMTNASYGGGVYLRCTGQKLFEGCRIENNRASDIGGVYSEYSATYRNCVIKDNVADVLDSGLNVYTSEAGGLGIGGIVLYNCLVYNNRGYRAGGLYSGSGESYIYNCTIVSNTGGAGGILVRFVNHGNNAYLQVVNSIVYSNTLPNIDMDNPTNRFPVGRISLAITNSCIITNSLANASWFDVFAPGKGNITNNPVFVDFVGQNYRLTRASPCVNMGLNQSWMTNAVDMNGRQRLRYGTVDMGAYELIFDGAIYKFY